MKKTWVGIILFFMLTQLLISPTVYIQTGNIFSEAFNDEYETMFFIFRNGDFIGMSTRNKTHIAISAPYAHRFFRKIKRKVSDIKIIIHNHPNGRCVFSDGDLMFLEILRRYGFRGDYLLFCNEEVYTY